LGGSKRVKGGGARGGPGIPRGGDTKNLIVEEGVQGKVPHSGKKQVITELQRGGTCKERENKELKNQTKAMEDFTVNFLWECLRGEGKASG